MTPTHVPAACPPGGGALDFSRLSRFPDVEAESLFAHDATDELLLATAAPALQALADADDGGSLTVVGDRYGALTLGAVAAYGLNSIRVHQDPLSAELALAANAKAIGREGTFNSVSLDVRAFAGAKVVLWQLPRSLDELTEVAGLIAEAGVAEIIIFAGGRVKHMSLAMNKVLEQFFESVVPGRAWRKSRLLVVKGPRKPVPASNFPKSEFNQALGLWLCAHGATFGGTKLDLGTRFLLEFEPRMRVDAHRAIDLGCGNGSIGAYLAMTRPSLHVCATDQSAAAVESAAATAVANALETRMRTVRDDALASFPANSADLVVLNPPFHIGATVHAGIALKLFDAAARVLTPGGELWTVYNSHLDYRSQLRERVGETELIGRNSKFSVTVSWRRA